MPQSHLGYGRALPALRTQVPDHCAVPFEGGPIERGPSVQLFEVNSGATLHQEFGDSEMIAFGRRVKRRDFGLVVLIIDCRTTIECKSHDFQMSPIGGRVQQRETTDVTTVHVGASLEQQFDHAGLARQCRGR